MRADIPELLFSSREDFRAWLKENAETSEGVWLVFGKTKTTADHPAVQKMMKYLLERYLPGVGGWGDLYEPGVNDGAHVPWCGYNGEENTSILDEDERIMKYNPNRHSVLAAFMTITKKQWNICYD